MKNTIRIIIAKALILGAFSVYGQSTGEKFTFDSGTTGWGSGATILNEINEQGTIKISANNVVKNEITHNVFFFFGENINMSKFSTVTLKIRTTKNVGIQVNLIDNTSAQTNKNPQEIVIKTGDYALITYNFKGKFFQSIPEEKDVNSSLIKGLYLYLNGIESSSYTGEVFIDEIWVGDQAIRLVGQGIPGIKFNQLGYYPEAQKIAIVSSATSENFLLKDESNTSVFSGSLSAFKYFADAKDSVKWADFSDFKQEGRYKLVVEGFKESPFFNISNQVGLELAKASLKYFYYNRASTSLLAEHAGKWARSAGHPDDRVLIDASAADVNRPTGTIVSAPKGWYDAGDYNKYVVNSGISTYTLIALYERFSEVYNGLEWNLPESGNEIPDLLDEIKWNIDWMKEMQDPNDGGVYFKLTTYDFGGSIMPSANTATRYMMKKSTSATLNYAATLAAAYRVFKPYEDVIGGNYADELLERSKKAYAWALLNPSISFTNPSYVQTGGYGDGNFSDEKFWAATELFVSTRDNQYKSEIKTTVSLSIPFWQQTSLLAYMTLSHFKDTLKNDFDVSPFITKMNSFLQSERTTFLNGAYNMPSNGYYWGSNGDMMNKAMVFLQNYSNTDDIVSYQAALGCWDYVLGKNPLEYCFVTGFGTKSVKDPHHRPSEADKIVDPIPGMLAGGPNSKNIGQDNCTYPNSVGPATAYEDLQKCYTTNEVAINWNAPLACVTGWIYALQNGYRPRLVGLEKFKNSNNNEYFSLYPNPGKNEIMIDIQEDILEISIYNSNGLEVNNFERRGNVLDIYDFEKGLYTVQVQTSKGALKSKFIKL